MLGFKKTVTKVTDDVKDAFATLRGALVSLCAVILLSALMITGAIVVTA